MRALRAVLKVGAVLAASLAAVPSGAQVFTAATGGNNIIVTVGFGLSGNQCCRGSALDDAIGLSGVAPICTLPCGSPISHTYTCNWVGTHVITACWSDDQTNGYVCATSTIDVTDPMPASCNPAPIDIKFDIADLPSSADYNRVLLSNSHAGYPYPQIQSFLSVDKAIPVDLRIVVNGVATPGVPVTLQVTDPPDTSQYVVGIPGRQPTPGGHPNDNLDQTPPTLSGTGLTSLGNNTYLITSGANGSVITRLDLDANAMAGDNYQIVATATLPDGTTKTAKSGVITAWKRVFLEKRQMFRNGIGLATDAPAGVSQIIVPDAPINATTRTSSNRLQKDDNILLLHASSYGQPKGVGAFYSGLYRIVARTTTFTASAPSQGPGTITTDGTTAIVGVHTHFNKLSVGDVVDLPTSIPGQTEPRVVMTIADSTHVTVNTPPTIAGSGQNYSIGDPNLVVGQSYMRITLDHPLGESYQREPFAPISDTRLNDAVVRLAAGGITAADYFDLSDLLLGGTSVQQPALAFPSAYTEYVILPPRTPLTPLPHATFPSGIADSTNAQWFVNKWFDLPQPAPVQNTSGDPFRSFLYSTQPNHQKLLVGDASTNTSDTGQTFLTNAPANQVCTILDRGLVERAVLSNTSALFQLDAETIMQKIEVHELAHQWGTNGGPVNHCQQLGYDSAGPYPATNAPTPAGVFFCTMNVDPSLTMPAPWNPSLPISQTVRQYGNGRTTFHIVPLGNGQWDSEYFTIRNRPDPFVP